MVDYDAIRDRIIKRFPKAIEYLRKSENPAMTDTTPSVQPVRFGVTREQVAAALKRPETVHYVSSFGGRCSDCVNRSDGVCETSGLPCHSKDKAIQYVLRAVSYGIEHGFLEIPAPAMTDTAPSVQPVRAWAVVGRDDVIYITLIHTNDTERVRRKFDQIVPDLSPHRVIRVEIREVADDE